MNTIQFKYNKGFAYITLIGLVAFIIVTNCISVTDKTGIFFSDIFFSLLTVYFIYKAFLPAVKEQIALELNETEIVDFVRKRTVRWSNVKDIRQVNFKNSSGIAIDLNDKQEFMQDKNFWQKICCFLANSFYDTPMTIALQYISGDNKEILLTIKSYFETIKTRR